MTKRTGITLAIAAILTAVSAIVPSLVGERDVIAAKEETTSSITEAAQEPVYILKAYDGKLAVYLEGESAPQKIYDTFISALPEYDRALLSTGITVVGEEALARRIEDYTS